MRHPMSLKFVNCIAAAFVALATAPLVQAQDTSEAKPQAAQSSTSSSTSAATKATGDSKTDSDS